MIFDSEKHKNRKNNSISSSSSPYVWRMERAKHSSESQFRSGEGVRGHVAAKTSEEKGSDSVIRGSVGIFLFLVLSFTLIISTRESLGATGSGKPRNSVMMPNTKYCTETV